MLHLAFDIGGTFTDFVFYNDVSARAIFLKVPSVSESPEIAVLRGLDQLKAEFNLDLSELATALHATTAATNAILERKGAQVGVVATTGFRDVLIIGRQKRYETYDLNAEKRSPLVKRRHIVEVNERSSFEGTVLQPLDMASVDRAIEVMRDTGRESVAVVLMHSYANPQHEQEIRRRIQERLPNVSVSLSSDVSPKFREYERASTTVANAYIKPLLDSYLSRLDRSLVDQGFHGQLLIMQSSGGLIAPELARRYPVRIIESGPAAGVLMCAEVGMKEGFVNVLTFDMGGTTAKLGAIDDGNPAISSTFEVDLVHQRRGSGLPLNTPALELVEIGAGGGSIVRADDGMIAVGPESAGSAPGPVCYGRGGTLATVTDANLELGYLDREYFNGGSMVLHADAASDAIKRGIAEPLGMSVTEAAWGAHLIATKNMERALRLVSIERGRDPRSSALVAFGGSGPLHASRLARSLGIPTVIVPLGAGVGSAIGLLQANARFDASVTRLLRLDRTVAPVIAETYAGLAERVRQSLGKFGDDPNIQWSRYAYMRCEGQGFEIHVDLPDGVLDEDYVDRIVDLFHAAYERKHHWSGQVSRVEGVDWTLVATIPRQERTLTFQSIARNSQKAVRDRRPAWFPEAGGFVDTLVLDRDALRDRGSTPGPAIVEDPDCTIVVLPGDVVKISEHGNLLIDVAAGGSGA